MGRGLLLVTGAVVVVLLLITMAASLRLMVLLVQLVTLRYTLAIGALVLTFLFVDSRRQRYAKGFYSCSQVPPPLQVEDKTMQPEGEQQKGEEKMHVAAAASSVAHSEMLPSRQKVVTAPPSETESEEDDSETVGGEASAGNTMPSSTFLSRHSLSWMDGRTCSHTRDGEDQPQEVMRPRSSSTVGDSRSSKLNTGGKAVRISKSDETKPKSRVPRRRADTGMTDSSKQKERSRRATFASKQDVDVASRRLSVDKVEDALRLNGYWIGDYRVQRRLASRRGHTHSPKAK